VPRATRWDKWCHLLTKYVITSTEENDSRCHPKETLEYYSEVAKAEGMVDKRYN
jgi:hypothetical protein